MAGADVVLDRATGEVARFDDAAGWGLVRDRAGTEYFLHCTAIADGTRAIEVGTAVTFVVVAGRLGRREAAEVTPHAVLADSGPAPT